MKRLFQHLLTFSFLAFSSLLFAEGETLRLNLSKGSEFTMQSSIDIKYFSDATLSQQAMSTNIDATIELKVLNRSSEGIHTIQIEITKINAVQNMQGMTMNYDSENPSSEPLMAMMAKQFEPILKKPAEIKVDAQGKVLDNSSSDSGSPISVEAMAKQLFIELPSKELKTGSTWVQSQPIEGMDKNMSLRFKVIQLTSRRIKASYTLNEEEIKAGDEAVVNNVKSSGKVSFDRKTGRMVENNINQTMKVESPGMGTLFLVNQAVIKTVK